MESIPEAVWIILIIIILFVSSAIFEALKNRAIKRKFLKDILIIINNNQNSEWNEVLSLADHYEINRKLLLACLNNLARDIIIEYPENNDDIKEKINYFINCYHNDEPYDNLPPEITLYLKRVRIALSDKDNLLEPLVHHLRRLFWENSKDIEKQKRISKISLVVGVIGVIIGFLSIKK